MKNSIKNRMLGNVKVKSIKEVPVVKPQHIKIDCGIVVNGMLITCCR